MAEVKMIDFLECLDSIGEVWRNADGSKPADAVTKIKSKLSKVSASTIKEWVSVTRSEPPSTRENTRSRRSRVVEILSDSELKVMLNNLEQSAEMTGSKEAFAQLDELNLSSPNWTRLARLAGIKKVTGIERVKLELRSYLGGRSQLKIREKNVKDIFG